MCGSKQYIFSSRPKARYLMLSYSQTSELLFYLTKNLRESIKGILIINYQIIKELLII